VLGEVAGATRRPDQRDHLVAARAQLLHQPAADEPGAARHESSHLAPFGVRKRPPCRGTPIAPPAITRGY
jgi:hypothetical protein